MKFLSLYSCSQFLSAAASTELMSALGIFEESCLEKHLFTWDVAQHSRQLDSFSCGVYVCLYARSILLGARMVYKSSSGFLAAVRSYIWTTISNNSVDCNHDDCSQCGQADPPDRKLTLQRIRLSSG